MSPSASDTEIRRRGVVVPAWVAWAAIVGTVLIAVGAFWLSFTALADLAVRAGIAVGQAWVWPLIVDGIIVVATISVVALAPHGRRATWYPWTLLILGAVVSVAGNATHATIANSDVGQLLAAGIAAVPPLVLLAVTHLTVELTRYTSPPAAAPPLALAAGALEAPAGTNNVGAGAAPGTPVGAVAGRRRRVGRRVVADGPGQARAFRAKGWSNRQIAAELGVHPSTVGRWLSSPASTVDG
jgi:hypothetical protein